MALRLLLKPDMQETDNSEEHVERRVVYETVSSSNTKANAVTFAFVLAIAIALITWSVMQMS